MNLPADIISEILSHIDHPITVFSLRQTCRSFGETKLPPWNLEVWGRISDGKYSDEFAEKYYDELGGMIDWENRSEAFLDRHILDVEWAMINFDKCSEWFREKHGDYYQSEMLQVMEQWDKLWKEREHRRVLSWMMPGRW